MICARWVLALALALAAAARAFAQQPVATEAAETPERARARALFETGLAEAAQQRWVEAEQAFRLSSELVQRSSALYNLARARFELGRELPCLDALDAFDAAPDRDAASPYATYAAELKRRVLDRRAYVRVALTPEQAALRVDNDDDGQSGARRQLLLNAGPHEIEVHAPGYVSERWSFDVRAGASIERSFSLTALAAPALTRVGEEPREANPTPQALTLTAAGKPEPTRAHSAPVLPWVLIGSGALLTVAGIVTGVLAKNADDEFIDKCHGTTDCDPRLRPIQRRASNLATASDVLWISGVTLAAAGGVAFWVRGLGSSEQISAGIVLRQPL